ncbi:hypothetical protein J6590_050176 [Homalodisca vitripennis]|nr:hypothetical protein J6590_050176 [Homalodisca vitripennis]
MNRQANQLLEHRFNKRSRAIRLPLKLEGIKLNGRNKRGGLYRILPSVTSTRRQLHYHFLKCFSAFNLPKLPREALGRKIFGKGELPVKCAGSKGFVIYIPRPRVYWNSLGIIGLLLRPCKLSTTFTCVVVTSYAIGRLLLSFTCRLQIIGFMDLP